MLTLDHRIVIERAVGYLMGSQSLDPVSAFNQFRRTARSQRRKVAEIARELLVDRRPPDSVRN